VLYFLCSSLSLRVGGVLLSVSALASVPMCCSLRRAADQRTAFHISARAVCDQHCNCCNREPCAVGDLMFECCSSYVRRWRCVSVMLLTVSVSVPMFCSLRRAADQRTAFHISTRSVQSALQLLQS
jgi:hypothetical protein